MCSMCNFMIFSTTVSIRACLLQLSAIAPLVLALILRLGPFGGPFTFIFSARILGSTFKGVVFCTREGVYLDPVLSNSLSASSCISTAHKVVGGRTAVSRSRVRIPIIWKFVLPWQEKTYQMIELAERMARLAAATPSIYACGKKGTQSAEIE